MLSASTSLPIATSRGDILLKYSSKVLSQARFCDVSFYDLRRPILNLSKEIPYRLHA